MILTQKREIFDLSTLLGKIRGRQNIYRSELRKNGTYQVFLLSVKPISTEIKDVNRDQREIKFLFWLKKCEKKQDIKSRQGDIKRYRLWQWFDRDQEKSWGAVFP